MIQTSGVGEGAVVGLDVGTINPSRSVAVPPAGTSRVVGSDPAVCCAPGGNVRLRMEVITDPAGASVSYMPLRKEEDRNAHSKQDVTFDLQRHAHKHDILTIHL